MRWFKHLSNASNDEKLAELIEEFGLEGYGLYWIILEKVSQKITEKNETFCKYSGKFWANFGKISEKKFRKMVKFMEKIKLFSIKYEGKNEKYIIIDVPKILKYRDEYTKKKIKKSGQTPDKLRTMSGQTPDKLRTNSKKNPDNVRSKIQIQIQNTDTDTDTDNINNNNKSLVSVISDTADAVQKGDIKKTKVKLFYEKAKTDKLYNRAIVLSEYFLKAILENGEVKSLALQEKYQKWIKDKYINNYNWLNDMRLLIKNEKLTDEEVKEIIDFATTDDFWKANILSPNKLYKKYNILIIKKNKKQKIDVKSVKYNAFSGETKYKYPF